MTTEHYFGIAFRVKGVDPDAVTTLLGVAPTHAMRKGETRKSRIPNLVSRMHYWSLDFKVGDFYDRLETLFEFIAERTEPLSELRASDGKLSVYAFVSPSGSLGFELTPDQMATLSRMSITFGIETHCPKAKGL
jgi:Domain of unknown function (DUF4279)